MLQAFSALLPALISVAAIIQKAGEASGKRLGKKDESYQAMNE